MTLATERARPGRIPIRLIECDLDYCANEMSDAQNSGGACTAIPDGNLWTDSEDLTKATSLQGAITPDFETMQQDTSTGLHGVLFTIPGIVAGIVIEGFMVQAQYVDWQYLGIVLYDAAGSANALIDLVNGFVLSQSGNGIGVIIKPDGLGGWFIFVYYSVTTTGTDMYPRLYFADSSNNQPSFTGDGASSIQIKEVQAVSGISGRLPYYCKASGAAVAANVAGICYKTIASCKAVNVYSKTTKTYRFCEDQAQLPITLGGLSAIRSIQNAPTRITPGQGLGYRAALSISLVDFPHNDVGIDPYVDNRSYDPFSQGTFFGKLKARNPYAQYRPLRLLSGYLNSDGSYDAANMDTRLYFIDRYIGPDDKRSVKITAKDILSRTDPANAQFPAASTGTLSAALAITDTTIYLSTGDGANYNDPTTSGKNEYVLIGKEIIQYTAISGDTLTGCTRGTWGTTAAKANGPSGSSSGDSVQQCEAFESVNVVDAIYKILCTYSPTATTSGTWPIIDPGYVDLASWNTEKTNSLSGFTLDGIISKPEAVNHLIGELMDQCLLNVWWDERLQKVQLKALSPPSTTTSITDADNQMSSNVEDDPTQRISELWVFYGLWDRQNEGKPESYSSLYIAADIGSEGVNENQTAQIKKVYSRWFSSNGPIISYASRMLKWLSTTPKLLTIDLDAKDSALWANDSITLSSRILQDVDGSNLPTNFMLLEAQEIEVGSQYRYKGINSPFFGRYIEIMADGSPDYTDATDAQKAAGFWIAPDSGVFTSDGQDAYQIQ